LKLINGIVAVFLLATLLQNRQPYLALAGIALVLLWALSLRLSKGLGFRRLEWAIVICLAYWVASYFLSVRDFHNFVSIDFLRRDGALLVSYTTFLAFLGWPLKPGPYRNFWILFVLLLALIAIPGLAYCLHVVPYPIYVERLGIVSFDPGVGGRIFIGWYEAHNTAGGVYALGSVLTLALTQEAKLTPKLRQFMWGLFLCCLGGLIFTYSRGGYLGFLSGAAYIFPLRKVGRTIRVGILIGVPVLLVGVMTSAVFNRIDSITDPYYGTNADRLRIWGEALDDFEASPIIGIGYSRFNDAMVDFKGVEGLYWIGEGGTIVNDDSHAHNSYLHFLAEGGIIGLLLTLRVWWCAWAELSFYEYKMAKTKLRGFHKATKACLLTLLVLSVTEHMLGKGSVALVAMSLIGMILATSRLEWRALQNAERQARNRASQLARPILMRPAATVGR
jgi:O-antigen ligase